MYCISWSWIVLMNNFRVNLLNYLDEAQEITWTQGVRDLNILCIHMLCNIIDWGKYSHVKTVLLKYQEINRQSFTEYEMFQWTRAASMISSQEKQFLIFLEVLLRAKSFIWDWTLSQPAHVSWWEASYAAASQRHGWQTLRPAIAMCWCQTASSSSILLTG